MARQMKDRSAKSYMSAAQRRALGEERARLPEKVRTAFDQAFSTWKNAWFGGGLAMSSNPQTRAVGKEYDNPAEKVVAVGDAADLRTVHSVDFN